MGTSASRPLTPDGVQDAAHGITEIIVGTGGESQANYLKVHPASRVRSPKDTYGVLRLSLLDNRYAAKFLASSGTFTDDIPTTNCHGAPATTPPPPNVAPTASFSQTCSNLVCSFTDNSTDSDGIIRSRSWNFGDNTAVGTATPQSHTYSAAGTYHVTLTVTDDDGATNATSKDITVGSGGTPPPPTSIALTVTSKPSTTLSYAVLDWTGATGDSVEVFRNSTQGGALAKITRTENDGHLGSTRSNSFEPITYTFQICQKGQAPGQAGAVCSNTSSPSFPPGSTTNPPPTAAFSQTCTNLACIFTDNSTDNGSIASRSWNFGDNTTGTAQPPEPYLLDCRYLSASR